LDLKEEEDEDEIEEEPRIEIPQKKILIPGQDG
jgi:hypothetical protein